MMETPPVTEEFEITWQEKQYPCKRISIAGRMVFVIGFTQRPLYLSKGTDVNQQDFWVSIPPDTKLSHVVSDLGKQIDEHYQQQNIK